MDEWFIQFADDRLISSGINNYVHDIHFSWTCKLQGWWHTHACILSGVEEKNGVVREEDEK